MPKLKEMRPGVYCHYCPGCECTHWVYTDNKMWELTGDVSTPTIRPSLAHNRGERKAQCHYHITDGKLEYFFDTHHKYRSETIEMPDWDEAKHHAYITRPRHEENSSRNGSPRTNMVCGFNFNDRS